MNRVLRTFAGFALMICIASVALSQQYSGSNTRNNDGNAKEDAGWLSNEAATKVANLLQIAAEYCAWAP